MVHFLGHIISENGVTTDPEKVKLVDEWPFPMGTNTYRAGFLLHKIHGEFCTNCSTIRLASSNGKKKYCRTSWSEDAFDTLKQHLTTLIAYNGVSMV